MQTHKRKFSNDSSTCLPPKSAKRGRFSSLFGLSFLEYDHGRLGGEKVYSSSSSLVRRIGPKAPPTCTVSLETAGVLENITNASPSPTVSHLPYTESSSPSSTVALTPSSTPPPRFRCSASSSQSLFKGHHKRSLSFSASQDDLHLLSNLRRRGDAKLVAMVRRAVMSNANGACATAVDSQDAILAHRLSGYLDQWGWREREENLAVAADEESLFEMDVDSDRMEVDVCQETPSKPSLPSSRFDNTQSLTLDQLVATLTLKHRERSTTTGRKERTPIQKEMASTVSKRTSPGRSSSLRTEWSA